MQSQRSIGDLLREAAAVLEQSSHSPTTPQTTAAPAPPPPPPDRPIRPTSSTRAEVLRLFRPYNSQAAPGPSRRVTGPTRTTRSPTFTHKFFCLSGRRQDEVPTMAEKIQMQKCQLGEQRITLDKFCSAADFTKTILNTYPPLSNCGGYQLLRAKGSSRSKQLSIIPCPRDGYTPLYLSTSANIGQALIYIRPLQRDIDMKPLTPADDAMAVDQCMVDCIYCGESFMFSTIQDHVDVCESMDTAHQASRASTTSGSLSEASSCEAVASQFEAGTPGSEANPFEARTVSLETSYEDWKLEPDLKEAAKLFRKVLLRNAEEKPALQITVDLNSDEVDRERAMLTFYKQPNVDWSRPLDVRLKGDAAIGDGVKRHFFSMFLDKIHSGLQLDFDNGGGKTLFFVGEADHKVPSTCLPLLQGDLFRVVGRFIGHSFLNGGPVFTGLSQCFFPLLCGVKEGLPVIQLNDCPDLDVLDVANLLESQATLTSDEKDMINNLAMNWDLPTVTASNRRWLAEQVLYHGIIGRREKQVTQLRHGLKDTGVFAMIKERPDLVAVLFPRCAEAELAPEVILDKLIWPEPDSEDEDDIPNICKSTGYLREYINSASPSQLRDLIIFWTGWAVLPDHLYVEVEADLAFPVASTCFTTLKIPARCGTFAEFSAKLDAALSSSQYGFGRI